MFRYLLGAVFLAAGCGGAFAAAYDDFAKGVAAYERGDAASAISALSAALAAPDLAPNLKITAYLDRAGAYLNGGQCALALEDLNTAKTQDADDPEIAPMLAAAHYCAGDFKAAGASYTAMIDANPTPSLYLMRGRTRWAMGDFSGAAADFAALNAAQPNYPYAVLWLALARLRQGNPDFASLENAASEIDMSTWPGPVVELYLGKAKPEDVETDAKQGDAGTLAKRQCEADFYVAEWKIAQNDAAAARPLLESAASNCPRNFVERGAARIEMARLK